MKWLQFSRTAIYAAEAAAPPADDPKLLYPVSTNPVLCIQMIGIISIFAHVLPLPTNYIIFM